MTKTFISHSVNESFFKSLYDKHLGGEDTVKCIGLRLKIITSSITIPEERSDSSLSLSQGKAVHPPSDTILHMA